MDKQRRNVTIPNREASNEEKESKDYGLEYARYIEFEWITGNDYASRKKKFEELEALRDNEVDIDRFKNMLNIPKDQAYLSLNWEFTSGVATICKIVPCRKEAPDAISASSALTERLPLPAVSINTVCMIGEKFAV